MNHLVRLKMKTSGWLFSSPFSSLTLYTQTVSQSLLHHKMHISPTAETSPHEHLTSHWGLPLRMPDPWGSKAPVHNLSLLYILKVYLYILKL